MVDWDELADMESKGRVAVADAHSVCRIPGK